MKAISDKDKKTKKKRVMGFQVIENECIWMKAGVVNFRICDNAYDCYNCPFDRGMRNAMKSGTPVEKEKERPAWVDSLKTSYHGASRPCRHALTGNVDAPKICTMNYECFHCPYDQMLDELDLVGFTDAPRYRVVSGYRMADDYYYHMGHSWARFEHGGRVRVGFDDFMVKLFGTMRELSLPPLGATLKQGEKGWAFARNGHEAAVLSPVSGTVLSVNQKTREHPEITNHDPYQEGWLFIIEPDLPKRNLKKLYFDKEGYEWMEKESKKLMGLMGQEYEQLVSTGGEVINDIFGNYPELGWDSLVKTFLHTDKG